jgi:hypothetical protein
MIRFLFVSARKMAITPESVFWRMISPEKSATFRDHALERAA